ncbi:MAG: type II CAAX endopeptidase family protein [Actinomycetaceae bacterium]|nr:type II CAAX endopeptidase family protein [Actinomycetaceae bacterium]
MNTAPNPDAQWAPPAIPSGNREGQEPPETPQQAVEPFAGSKGQGLPGYEQITLPAPDAMVLLKNAYGDVRDFLRGGRTPNYRWWKPLVALCCIAIFWVALSFGMGIPIYVISELVGHPVPLEGGSLEHVGSYLATKVVTISFIPAVFLGVYIVEGRRGGGLSSIAGRLRWDVMGHAVILAGICYAPLLIWGLLSSQPNFNVATAVPILLLAFLLVPFQAAGEEYLFRGWLLQTLRGWGMPVWLTIIISAIPFAVLHGYGWIATTDVFLFAICMSWLVVRTGGLEGAIAIHAVGNIQVTINAVISGRTSMGDEGAQVSDLIVSVVLHLVVTALADWWLRRVVIQREGREAMTGVFGGPVGDFGLARQLAGEKVSAASVNVFG